MECNEAGKVSRENSGRNSLPLLWLILALFTTAGFSLRAAEQDDFDARLTVEDLVTVLDLNVIKTRFKPSPGQAFTLLYWVERLDPKGNKEVFDETAIGLGDKESTLLFRLPRSTDKAGADFGIFGEVNTALGTSKMTAGHEGFGAEAWLKDDHLKILPGQETIVAIRVFGYGYESEGNGLNEQLASVLKGEYTWVDVFKVRAVPVP